jgi:hypothetical protein
MLSKDFSFMLPLVEVLPRKNMIIPVDPNALA